MAGFTPFHNVNCPFGFIAATSKQQAVWLGDGLGRWEGWRG